jgi:hypothetical protein
MCFSPNSKKLALVRSGVVWLHGIAADEPVPATQLTTNGYATICFSRDSTSLLFAGGDEGGVLFDVASGKRLFTIPATTAQTVAFSRSGAHVAVGDPSKRETTIWMLEHFAGP